MTEFLLGIVQKNQGSDSTYHKIQDLSLKIYHQNHYHAEIGLFEGQNFSLQFEVKFGKFAKLSFAEIWLEFWRKLVELWLKVEFCRA